MKRQPTKKEMLQAAANKQSTRHLGGVKKSHQEMLMRQEEMNK